MSCPPLSKRRLDAAPKRPSGRYEPSWQTNPLHKGLTISARREDPGAAQSKLKHKNTIHSYTPKQPTRVEHRELLWTNTMDADPYVDQQTPSGAVSDAVEASVLMPSCPPPEAWQARPHALAATSPGNSPPACGSDQGLGTKHVVEMQENWKAKQRQRALRSMD